MTHKKTLTITTPSDRELVITREFDAPRHLVFKAFTTPELVRRWLGGGGEFGGWQFAVCEIDARVGGSFRYLWRRNDGMEMGMSGVYLEVVEPERLVSTEVFDQKWYEGEATGTIELTEHKGKTTMTQTLRYSSKAVRDAVLSSPMESGVTASYNALADLLATLD